MVEINPKKYSSFCNRLTLCAFAICFMWSTSLRIVVTLVDYFISAPSPSSVYDVCQFAYDQIVLEQSSHYECAENHLNICYQNMDHSVLEEKHRVITSQVLNNVYLRNLSAAREDCSSSVKNSITALTAWSSLNKSYTIAYNGISPELSQKCKAMLKDASREHTEELSTNTSQFIVDTDFTMSQMSAYTSALTGYNKDYIMNKTSLLRKTSLSIVQNVNITDINLYIDDSLRSMRDIMDISIVCLSIVNVTDVAGLNITASCPFDTSMSELYDHYRELVLAFMKDYATMAADSFGKLKSDYNGVVNTARSFYNSVAGATGVMKMLSSLLPGVNLCGKSTPDWCDFSVNLFPDNFVDLPTFRINQVSMPTVATLGGRVDHIVASLREELLVPGNELKAFVNNWYEGLVDELTMSAGFSTNDYDPPKYGDFSASPGASKSNITFEDALSDHQQRTKSYEESVRSIIQLIALDTADISNMYSEALTSSRNYSSHAVMTPSTVPILSSFTATTQHFSVQYEAILSYLTPLLSIQALIFLFDYIYRAIQTMKLISTYWSGSHVKLPPVDVRYGHVDYSAISEAVEVGMEPNSKSNLGAIAKGCQSCKQAFCDSRVSLNMLVMASYAWMYTGLLIVLLVFVGYIVVGMFMIEYHSYVNACVTQTTDQSYLSDMIYFASLNYAASSGNERITQGIVTYNYDVGDMCMRLQHNTTSQSSYDSHYQKINDLHSKMEDSIKTSVLLTDCVNMSEMNTLFLEHCDYTLSKPMLNDQFQCPVDSDGYLFYPPSVYLANVDEICNTTGVSGTNLHVDTFNCETLPACLMTCNGPNKEVIGAVTKQCSCMMEWYFNSSTLQSMVGMLIFIALHISRHFVCTGLCMIYWCELNPHVFYEYIGSSNFKGESSWQNHIKSVPISIATPYKRDEAAPSAMLSMTDQKCADSERLVESGTLEFADIYKESGVNFDSNRLCSCESGASKSVNKDFDCNYQMKMKQDVMHCLIKDMQNDYVYRGYVYLCGGVLINIAWIVLLHQSQQNIIYTK